MHAEQVTDPLVYHGEGPVWYSGWGGLQFMDMLAGDVMTLKASGALDQITVSNGLEWSRDGSRCYHNDTATFSVWVFDYDVVGGLTGRRVFAELPDQGRPDGLTVDAEGGVWTAVSNGGAVYRYSPEGTLEEKVGVPARKVTACTFGGPDLDQLFITTSQENIDTDEDPLAGSLFRADVGVSGLPVRLFAGTTA